jgi:DNA-binding NarL/FixJ family response regulator
VTRSSRARLTLLYLGGNAITREAMRAALTPSGVRVVEAVSIQDGVDAVGEESDIDLVVVDDAGLGEQRALEAVATLLQMDPARPVGVVSDSRSPVYPADVVRAGASAYLSKETGLAEFRHALDRVAQGHLVVDPMVTRTLLGVLGPARSNAAEANGSGRPDERVPHLSAVERRVMALVAEGKANKQIGSALGISPLTVKNHLARIRARLGAGDKAQALAIALRAGLLD